ncbi:MAG: histidine--tRNA ligase [Selenomonadaceae bacterium]|nr:histidine--tRNA ligase [Selenomonadaceae bacterium]
MINAPRGTRDILPRDVVEWQMIERKIREICDRFGFEEIRTPIFEHTELFQRGIGENTDVVEKEMYTFEDRGGRSLTLRPENTASTLRAYLQNKLFAEKSLNKLFYIGSMFRYDRPQAGRMREFHQFGVESIGEMNPAVDAEVITLAWDFLTELGLTDLELRLNSVGCPKCRPQYKEVIQKYFRDKLPELCHDCQSRFDKNPMRLLDCKIDSDKFTDVPIITYYLCDECRNHFETLQKLLEAGGIKFKIDPKLVRGLDYYTKTAFEIRYSPLGAQSAVAGGGRYDGLVEELGGDSTPAVGFATGIERIILALEQQDLLLEKLPSIDCFIIALGDLAQIPAFKFLTDLRRDGKSVAMDFAGRSMKAQMKQASKSGAKFAVILGEDEIRSNMVTFKNLETSDQELIPVEKILERI